MEDPLSTSKSTYNNRIIAHIDLDCFYVGVERYVNPTLADKPVAVVQYNPFGDLKTYGPTDSRVFDTNGGIIAVSYEARAFGVKRNMRANEAKELCKELICVQVPTAHGKADLNIYRKLSNDVVNIMTSVNHPLFKNIIVEKASIDEVYVDLTTSALSLFELLSSSTSSTTSSSIPKTDAWSYIDHASDYSIHDYVNYFLSQQSSSSSSSSSDKEGSSCTFKLAGDDMAELSMSRYDLSKGHHGTSTANSSLFSQDWLNRPLHIWSYDDQLLLCGSMLIQHIRYLIAYQLKLTCSSGIAHNKLLAKIASTMHKPNKLTVFPSSMIKTIFMHLPITRVPGYNGKLGQEISNRFPMVQYIGEFEQYDKDMITNMLGGNEYPRHSHDYHNIESSSCRLLQAAVGIDHDAVIARSLPKSIGCGKTFRHQNSMFLHDISAQPRGSIEINADIQHHNKLLFWLHELGCELHDRCNDDSISNNRIAQQLSIGFSIHIPNPQPSNTGGWKPGHLSFSKVIALPKTSEQIAIKSYEQIRNMITSSVPITMKAKGYDYKISTHAHISYLSLSASDFVLVASDKNNIASYFSKSSDIIVDVIQSSSISSSPSISSPVPAIAANPHADTIIESYQPSSYADIDPSIMLSLPADIQEELRNALKPRIRPEDAITNGNVLKRMRQEEKKTDSSKNSSKNRSIMSMFHKI